MPRIALLQLTAHSQPSENITKTEQAIRKAAASGAQIVCTQELFTTKYFCTTQDTNKFDLAEPIPGPLTQAHQELAKELSIVIVASGFEKRASGLYHNTGWVIDANGSYLGNYRKMHIPQDPGFEEKFYFTPGDTGFKCFNTTYGKLGLLICWDQWYPEAARITALMGAEILIYPTAIGWIPDEKDELGEAQHHAWQAVQCGHAVANACYVATINRTGTEGQTEFWGQSFVANHYGQIIKKAPTSDETILCADLDLEALEEHRRIWPFFRDRRIDVYSSITERCIDETT